MKKCGIIFIYTILMIVILFIIILVIFHLKNNRVFKKKINLYNKEDLILSKLNHKNIVKLIKVKKLKNHKILYLKDEHLLSIGSYQPFTVGKMSNEKNIKKIAKQLLDALSYIHEKNIIHNDIHPHNILYNPKNNNVIVIDFDSSKIGDNILLEKKIECIKMFYFTPPEKLINEKINLSNKIDIYGIGAILHVLLTGRTLFSFLRRKDVLKLLEENRNKEVNGISYTYLSNYSKECIDLLEKLVINDPDKRISAKDSLNHNWFKNS